MDRIQKKAPFPRHFLLWVGFLFPLLGGCYKSEPFAGETAKQSEANSDTSSAGTVLDELISALPDEYGPLDYAEFPKACVQIVPPQGCIRAERFHGFRNVEKQASLKISTSPVSFPNVSGRYLQQLAAQARQNKNQYHFQKLAVDGIPGVYLYVVQPVHGGILHNHYLAFGDQKFSWMIAGVYPDIAKDEYTSEFVKSIFSIKRTSQPVSTINGSDVDFELSSSKLVLTPGWTKTVTFTADGVFPVSDPSDPFFKAEPSFDEIRVEENDRAKFAYQNISPSSEIVIQKLTANRDIQLGGLPGRELEAEAHDYSTNTPIYLYTVLLFEEDGIIKMHGWHGRENKVSFMDEFRAIARSFKQKTQ